ncbi:hypothetical protein SAMN05444156_0626 [Verrucomicrobium sp. GAS474]|uniref:hypothetical protein n=1 Tax=Verrucomicrobium sp. GAS474 TaxID=1882831 RepID=UPI00087AF88A|nr:hypothetical protein [Verrucomicrobium sp. GAS474]SDT90716.1 hypothetical protein SAMN05444156_0626 [Verrucomicrobium sp. GAS474]
MIITLPIPDDVAREYFVAAEKLTTHLAPLGRSPDARTLMVMALSSMTAEEMVGHFDLALRSIVGVPIPSEVSPDFQN